MNEVIVLVNNTANYKHLEFKIFYKINALTISQTEHTALSRKPLEQYLALSVGICILA